MGIRSIALAASTGVWLFSVGIAPAYAATTVYSYEGNTFNSFSGGGPWDATDKITASLTMSSALGANLVNEYVIPVSWSVSDGVQTITEATGNANQIRFSTNELGEITEWFAFFGENASPGPSEGDVRHEITTEFSVFYDLAADSVLRRVYASGGWVDDEYASLFSYSPATTQGVWTATSTAVPVPAAVWLFGSGLIGLVGMARRKKA